MDEREELIRLLRDLAADFPIGLRSESLERAQAFLLKEGEKRMVQDVPPLLRLFPLPDGYTPDPGDVTCLCMKRVGDNPSCPKHGAGDL